MKRNIFVAIATILIAGSIVYLYISKARTDNTAPAVGRETDQTGSRVPRSVSAVQTYSQPRGKDTVRFTLALDADGTIVSVRTTDVLKNEEVSPQLETFSQNLLIIIKGKKLSELQAVDKVGASSLTTKAFNAALADLKSKI